MKSRQPKASLLKSFWSIKVADRYMETGEGLEIDDTNAQEPEPYTPDEDEGGEDE